MLSLWFLAMVAVAAPLPGVWRVDIHAASTSQALWVQTPTALHTVGLLRPSGAAVWYQVCDLKADGGPIQTTIPYAWIESLPPREVEATLSADRVWVDLGTASSGFDPNEVSLDDVDVGTSFDQDGDGAPGLTLNVVVPLIGRGAVYVVEQSNIQLDGRLLDPTHVEGDVEVRAQHVVVGASPAILARQAQVRAMPEQSWFALTRVDAGTTCHTLKQNGDSFSR